MGVRLQCHIFKGLSEADFCRLLETTLRKHGGDIEWNKAGEGYEYCRIAHAGEVHALQIDQFWFRRSFAEEFASSFGRPWISVRIQESSLWDFTCMDGPNMCSSFSTLPQYWEENPEYIESQKGDPQSVAALWGVPVNRIERYMRNWGMTNIDDDEGTYDTVLRGRAYPTDKYEYGDIWQMIDFVRALCGIDIEPMLAEHPPHRWISPKGP